MWILKNFKSLIVPKVPLQCLEEIFRNTEDRKIIIQTIYRQIFGHGDEKTGVTVMLDRNETNLTLPFKVVNLFNITNKYFH